MTVSLGLLFAFGALFAWGFGDFFIQRTARAVGSVKALFFIGIIGMVGLFPLVSHDLPKIAPIGWLLLFLLGFVVIFAALFDFEALKDGKISIIEPLIGLELPITVGLSIGLGHEILSGRQLVLIGIIFIGLIMAVTIHHTHLHYHKRIFEKGVIFAGLGAVGLALTNYLTGVASQQISPLVAIWFTHTWVFFLCGFYLLWSGKFKELWGDFRRHPQIILGEGIFDNLAWISFGYATTYLPIAIVTTISESYIALAVVLGLFVNREKLKPHQIVGVILAVVGVIVLSSLTSS